MGRKRSNSRNGVEVYSDEDKHREGFYIKVDYLIQVLLGNPRYMQQLRTGELIELVKEKFNCVDRTAYRLLNEARKQIRAIGKKDIDKAFIKAIRDREFIIQACKEAQEWKTALLAMADRDKIQGLYIEHIEETQRKYILERGTIENKEKDKQQSQD